MNVKIEKSWKKILNSEFKKEYFNSLVTFLKDEYKNNIIYPSLAPCIFEIKYPNQDIKGRAIKP